MKLAEIVIIPRSFFRTPLKGDTIFGHFVWQIIYDPSILKVDLKDAIASYSKKPFVIFSSAFPRIYLNGKELIFVKMPDLPMHFWLNEEASCKTLKERKKWKKEKYYVRVDRDLKVNFSKENLFSQKEIFEMYKQSYDIPEFETYPQTLEITTVRMHNKINRLTSSTTGEGFSPYSLEQTAFMEYLEMSILVLFDEEVISDDDILKGFERIGSMGFGKDASTGFGRFDVCEIQELEFPKFDGCYGLYTTSPCVCREGYKKVYFQPFIRFGKHGSYYAISQNPFKNPIIMMDEGAVFVSDKPQTLPYIGEGLKGLSKVEENCISQGYSIVLPFYLKTNGDK